MQFIDCPIATYCIGMAASGAAVLLAAGGAHEVGRRLLAAALQDHDPPALRAGERPDISGHRDPGVINEEIMANEAADINEILAKHLRPADRAASAAGIYRARPLHDGDPGQGIRPRSTRSSATSPRAEAAKGAQVLIEIQCAGEWPFQEGRDPRQALRSSIARDTERDRYMTAIQAKEYGLVDEVVGHIPSAEAAKGALS